MSERIPTVVHGAPESGSLALFMRSFYSRRGEHVVIVPDVRHSENAMHEIYRHVAQNGLPRLETNGHPKILHEVGGRANGPKIRILIVADAAGYHQLRGSSAKMVWCWGHWDSSVAMELPSWVSTLLKKSQ